MGSGTEIRRRALAGFCFLAGAQGAVADCRGDQLEIRGDWGQARFSVEVADDPDERAIGLMNRENLARSAVILFVYERAQRVGFWMENTLIPLDMIFADESGVVTRIHENAIPLDRTTIEGGDQVQFVLEINGGLSSRLGIEVGSELRHPSIGEEASWACE